MNFLIDIFSVHIVAQVVRAWFLPGSFINKPGQLPGSAGLSIQLISQIPQFMKAK